MIELRISRMSGGTVPGVMEEAWESSEELLSALRSRFGDSFLNVSADPGGASFSLSVAEVSGLESPFSGWLRRMDVGFCSGVDGFERNGTGGKTFSVIYVRHEHE